MFSDKLRLFINGIKNSVRGLSEPDEEIADFKQEEPKGSHYDQNYHLLKRKKAHHF